MSRSNELLCVRFDIFWFGNFFGYFYQSLGDFFCQFYHPAYAQKNMKHLSGLSILRICKFIPHPWTSQLPVYVPETIGIFPECLTTNFFLGKKNNLKKLLIYNIKKYLNIGSWRHCYKTFFCYLRIFVKGWCFCPWQAYPAWTYVGAYHSEASYRYSTLW
jgi:hypothetical protein